MRTPAEDVKRAQVIFGNVVPEQIRLAENLQWIQLGSAGADEYVPAVPENVLLTNRHRGIWRDNQRAYSGHAFNAAKKASYIP